MKDRGWLDRYIEVWLGHVAAGGPDGAAQLARLVAAMTTDVVYEDVPSGARFTGRDGIARMARDAFLACARTDETLAFLTDGFANDVVEVNSQKFLFLPRPHARLPRPALGTS